MEEDGYIVAPDSLVDYLIEDNCVLKGVPSRIDERTLKIIIENAKTSYLKHAILGLLRLQARQAMKFKDIEDK